jgi:hypothetical protein
MIQRFVIAAAALFPLTNVALADIVPPNMKPANSMGRFENLGDFPDYVFFAAHHPDNPFLPNERKSQFQGNKIDLAQPEIGLSNHYTAGRQFLLAVPRKLVEELHAKPTNDWFDGKTPGVLQVELTGGVQYVPESDPRPAFWTVYNITIARDPAAGKFSLVVHVVGQDPSAPWSVRWLIAGGVGAMAVVMIGFYLMRMRKSPAPSQ